MNLFQPLPWIERVSPVKACGLDRRSPRPPSSREGDRPVGGGRSSQAVEGVRRRRKAQKTPPGGIFSRRGFFYALRD